MTSKHLVDYAIISFTSAEFNAMLSRFPTKSSIHLPTPRRAYVFRQIATHTDKVVSVALVRTVTQGLTEAQNIATDIIEDLNPTCILASGIAGAAPSNDIYLGDVVLATYIHDFSLKASTPTGVEQATHGYPVHRQLGNLIAVLPSILDPQGEWGSDNALNCPRPRVNPEDINDIKGSVAWKQKIKRSIEYHENRDRPTFVDGPIASSDELIKLETAAQSRQIVDRRILAVEMEAAGIAKACQRNIGSTPFLVVRAISDIVGLPRREAYTAYACNVAASFTKTLVHLDISERIHADSDATKPLSVFDQIISFGSLLPDPIPASVVARAHQIDKRTFHEFINESPSSIEYNSDNQECVVFSTNDLKSPDLTKIHSMLYELLNFIDGSSKSLSGIRQCRNALRLFLLLDGTSQRIVAERLFDTLDKPMKALGDKQLVLDVAGACVKVVAHESRSTNEAECEARARICGTSWAYQRMGKLDLAADEAGKSLELSIQLNSKKSIAFCTKCSGRLTRLRAEAVQDDAQERNRLFVQSIDELGEAVALFSNHDEFGADDPEVGDCYSLIGRTYLSKDDPKMAAKYVDMASTRLTDKSSKDFLDLEILRGDLAVRLGDYGSAYDGYNAVVETSHYANYQMSEIVARAFMQRARLHSKMGKTDESVSDYTNAATIWEEYHEHELADKASWEQIDLQESFSPPVRRLLVGERSFVIRTAACRHYIERRKVGSKMALSRRHRHDKQIMESCLKEARRNQALRRGEN